MDHINETLEELYLLDEGLREHEAMLRTTLQEIIAAKPASGFDPVFAKRLKQKLQARVSVQPRSSFIINLYSMIRLNKTNLLGGLVGVLAVALVVSNLPLRQGFSRPALAYEITPVGRAAFGTLSGATGKSSSVSATETGAPTLTSATTAGGAVSNAMLIRPEMYRPITYRYTGEALPKTLPQNQLEVFKRLKPSANSSAEQLQALPKGIIDPQSFSKAELRTVEIVENKDHGYIINMNFSEGVFSISQNWEKWDTCKNGICPELAPLTKKDLPPEEELFAIANNFLRDHGISTSAYGSPQIEQSPLYQIMTSDAAVPAAETAPAYIADTVSIVYPLRLKDQTVYELGGGQLGMRVTISIREKQVASVWDIRSERYESSLYDAETDSARIIRIAEQGGNLQGTLPKPTNALELELGTPTLGAARTWHTSNDGQTQEELYVPVYIFPVKAPSADASGFMSYYQPVIMVPLVKELLIEADQPLPDPGQLEYQLKDAEIQIVPLGAPVMKKK